ncbi:MAG: TylF/MycF/NovP-related O-methyltransferase [Candidatus Pacebacteria bacterium]|nr:TylF/MycF/NovP-related O-methyltransferase [Candidatus Paceibacterota bacterium]
MTHKDQTHKRFFEDTLESYNGKIAFLHIDVDIASSYITTLEKLFDKVESGGVVLFDEYKNPHWVEATEAIDKFLGGRYEIRKCKVNDKYYIVK